MKKNLEEKKYSAPRMRTKNSEKFYRNGLTFGRCESVSFWLPYQKSMTQRLFADDYNISIRSSHPNRGHRLLHGKLNKISTLASKNGFRFSSLKTYLVILKEENLSPLLNLYFYKTFKSYCAILQNF